MRRGGTVASHVRRASVHLVACTAYAPCPKQMDAHTHADIFMRARLLPDRPPLSPARTPPACGSRCPPR